MFSSRHVCFIVTEASSGPDMDYVWYVVAALLLLMLVMILVVMMVMPFRVINVI